MTSTSAVSFTINHIAAVFIPVLLGALWLISPTAVFLSGTVMSVISLSLSRFIPNQPSQDHRVEFYLLNKPIQESS